MGCLKFDVRSQYKTLTNVRPPPPHVRSVRIENVPPPPPMYTYAMTVTSVPKTLLITSGGMSEV